MRIALASVIVAVGLIALVTVPVRSDEEGEKAAVAQKLPPATSASVRRLLWERVEIPNEFQAAPVPLKVALQFLVEHAARHGESLPIMIDKQAFKEASPDVPDLLEYQVDFSPFVPSTTYRQFLESASSQLPGDGTYLVRGSLVVIVPAEAAKINRLLERNVAVEYRNKPLIAAIGDLSERTGLDIAVDSRCDDGNKKTVTLQTERGMTVRGILESIADMNELKVVVTPHRVTVLPQSIYLKRLADQVQEAKLRREIDNDPTIVEGPRLGAPNPAQ